MQDFHNLPVVGVDMHLYFNYSINKATFDETNAYTGGLTGSVNLGDVPQNLLTTGFVWQRNGWRVNLDGRYVGTQYMDNYDTGLPTNYVIHPYFTLNLGIAKTIEVKALNRTNHVRFGLNIDNLLNRYYINQADQQTNYYKQPYAEGIPGAPRSLMGSVTVMF
jgi:outer membrane receptor protein involved in Fe transport